MQTRHLTQSPIYALLAPIVDGGAVVIEVHDSGMGIAAEDMATLFDPFQRGAQATSAIEGAGIGLAVTKALVELMGGRITVASAPGRGSTFSVTLQGAGR